MTLPSILKKIVSAKEKRLQQMSKSYKKEIYRMVDHCERGKGDFKSQIAKEGLSIIGEIKKGSPTCGIIKEDFKPTKIAEVYEEAVDAVSVLTEEDYFFGSMDYLSQISQKIKLPTLRKDFIIDEFQIYESKALGASCILLISSLLEKETLKRFIGLCDELGLDALVEVHTVDELLSSLEVGSEILGINNRNLHTFETNIGTSLELCSHVPPQVLLVSESGFHREEDVSLLKGTPINGILVGESFMRAKDIVKQSEVLRNGYRY
ncbi:indole-3-glycerol phosphate synthase TrpC [Vallitalea okinawensis]|uniref:indole-3-glycerol phosphate synthase TrpC n=1 Tax=Vallitalea okinawensis TaxID=2078660 RepID=UPI000CFB4694|nr:indole-3-glycerol phosphate synthase TrpC [Vallitalea okinawensis]